MPRLKLSSKRRALTTLLRVISTAQTPASGEVAQMPPALGFRAIFIMVRMPQM